MNREDMIARLVGQAAAEGGDLVTLRALIEEASELGAARALSRLGLADDKASGDIDEYGKSPSSIPLVLLGLSVIS